MISGKGSWRIWLAGARPRTLSAAIVPVLVGTSVARVEGSSPVTWRVCAALVVAVALQVATNYANDYSDGIRGTDNDRNGPTRIVGSGLRAPAAVKWAAFGWFGVAGLAGLSLVFALGPELLIVGVASVAAGWFYTGGSKPYGYSGLGEVSVFVFFGLVATCGSSYVQTEAVTWLAMACGMALGLFATALLMANNLRDLTGDSLSGKVTLAVRIGDSRSRSLLAATFALALFVVLAISIRHRGALLALLAFPFVGKAMAPVLRGAVGPDLVPVLFATARAQLIFGVALAVGLQL